MQLCLVRFHRSPEFLCRSQKFGMEICASNLGFGKYCNLSIVFIKIAGIHSGPGSSLKRIDCTGNCRSPDVSPRSTNRRDLSAQMLKNVGHIVAQNDFQFCRNSLSGWSGAKTRKPSTSGTMLQNEHLLAKSPSIQPRRSPPNYDVSSFSYPRRSESSYLYIRVFILQARTRSSTFAARPNYGLN